MKKTKKQERIARRKQAKRRKETLLIGKRAQLPGWPMVGEKEWKDYCNTLSPEQKAGNIHVKNWYHGTSPDRRMENFVRLIVKPSGRGRIWLKDWKNGIKIHFCDALAQDLVSLGAVETICKDGKLVYKMPKTTQKVE